MRKSTFLFCAVGTLCLLGNWPAVAADMAVKAIDQAFPYGTSGWYWGVGTLAATTNAEVTLPANGATGNITTAGAGIGPVVGYHSGSAHSFKAIEGAVYWQNLGGSQGFDQKGAVGADTRADFSASGRVKIGGVGIMSTLGSLLPGLGLGGVAPLVPAPVTGQPNMPYFAIGFDVNKVSASIIGVETKGWQVTPTIGMGFISQIMDPITGRPTGYVTDVSAEYTPAGRGFVVGGDDKVDANLGRKFLVRASILR